MSGAINGRARVEPLRKPVTCPNCERPSTREDYPFCSGRCREVDMHKWFSGSYAIASDDYDTDGPES